MSDSLAVVPVQQLDDEFTRFKNEHSTTDRKIEALLEINRAQEMPFRTKRPKNFTAGMSSGFMNIGTGLAVGLGTFLGAPIQGATKGVGGFCKGAAIGILGLVVLPIAGLGTGLYQMGRGIVAGPSAIQSVRVGKVWNKETRKWEYFNLQEALVALENQHKCYEWAVKALVEELSSQAVGGVVADTSYYDQLKVEPTASQTEIRKAYFQLAKELHPDKVAPLVEKDGTAERNPETGELVRVEEAKKTFQALGQAYNVLSDPAKRREYDLRGLNEELTGGEDMEELEFKLIFCSDELVEFFGPPQIVMEMEEEMGNSLRDDVLVSQGLQNVSRNLHKMTLVIEQMKLARRIECLIQPLVELIMKQRDKEIAENPSSKKKVGPPNFNCQDPEFRAGLLEWEKRFAEKVDMVLLQKPGYVLMSMMAWEYINKAQQKLGEDSCLGHRKTKARMQANRKNVSQHVHVVKKALHVNKEMQEASKSGNDQNFVESTMDTLLEVNSLFAMKLIRGALRYVLCECLVEESEIDKRSAIAEEVRVRAHILQYIGKLVKSLLSQRQPAHDSQWTDAMLQAKLRHIQKTEVQMEQRMNQE